MINPILPLIFAGVAGFDWDEGNARKNDKHSVSAAEAEEVFFNQPLLIVDDEKHSQTEARYHALGRTHQGRALHLTFTLRIMANEKKIRIISARPMHRKEQLIYEKAT